MMCHGETWVVSWLTLGRVMMNLGLSHGEPWVVYIKVNLG